MGTDRRSQQKHYTSPELWLSLKRCRSQPTQVRTTVWTRRQPE